MLRYLFDPANAITLMGLALSTLAICCAVQGRPELGLALALWALLADHLDGMVARRTPNRPKDVAEVGKNLDALTDLVGACVFPAALLFSPAFGSWLSVAVAVALVVVGALRLSLFNSVRFDLDHFVGVPITYVIPAIALLYLAAFFVGGFSAATYLPYLVAALVVLHLTPLRVPKLTAPGYVLVFTYCVTSSVALISTTAVFH